MSWNNRAMRHMDDILSRTCEWYAIHEVYYDENGNPTSVTVDSIRPLGETPEELKEELERFLLAFEKPILDFPTLEEVKKNDSDK